MSVRLKEDEVKDSSLLPRLGARSLQSSYDQKATYQEVKELSATKRLSSFISTNLGEGDSLPVVEHEMGDLPLLVFFVKVGVSSIFSSCAYDFFFHLLKRQKGIVRLFFPYVEQGGFLPTEG